MSRALTLARKGLYTSDPNPRVGCVLVSDANIVGEGWHTYAGDPHAEVNAIRAAAKASHGSTAYVTLEPCSHHGRTGPCTQALIEAGVKRVVIATQDPNPLVDGGGVLELERAGIATKVGIMRQVAMQLNRGFFHRFTWQRPFVRCKLAMSMDARTAMASGESQWITSAAARRDVQRLRASSSAIMTGVGTVLSDDPSLTVRAQELGDPTINESTVRQPLRVVVDSRLRTPPSSRILKMAGKTLIATTSNAHPQAKATLGKAGAEVLEVAQTAGRVALESLLAMLAKRDINEVLLECGPTLAGAMLRAAMIDELVIYVAPVLLGDTARGLLTLPGLTRLDEGVRLKINDVRPVGPDWRIIATPVGTRQSGVS